MLSIDILNSFKEKNRTLLPDFAKYINKQKYNDRSKYHKKNHNWIKKDNLLPKNNWFKKNKDNDEKLYSKFTSILNKLTDNNLVYLHDKLINLEIENKNHLEKLINLIFYKAMSEPKFSKMYANLCLKLSTFYLIVDDNKIFLKEFLINKCQHIFNETLRISNESEFELNDTFKFKEQIDGSIIFIGELYNHDLLNNKIINLCFKLIFNKLNNNGNNSFLIKNICILLKKVGKKFSYNNENIVKIINKIDELKNHKDIQLKEKFTIMDVLDLKIKEKWKIN